MNFLRLVPGDDVKITDATSGQSWIYRVRSCNFFDLDVTDKNTRAVDITMRPKGIGDLLIKTIRLESDNTAYLYDDPAVPGATPFTDGTWTFQDSSGTVEIKLNIT